ncbi:alkyl/aryl-sulfatase [Delftia sp. HK171]|uniref:alkyl/aryl-sulfatase n=1 Tax=Delftia sp. HK171 TaxID=1920191 RepID=UPI001152BE70|nr:alkyl sulfatase dimerization domain-containing protein [Delftia sp. HK171]TQL84281.1 alkyl sulfatase BDS1-like metallo-beta-lactamase superfamily hydrolase [Delftia sp. HK171]
MQASHPLPRALARPSRLLASLATAALLGACAHGTLPVSDMARPQPASAATRAAQQAALAQQPLDDAQAMEDARRGLIAPADTLVVRNAQGRPIWSMQSYAFLEQDQAPDTVHPALWRQAQRNRVSGLFQVTERLYQVRGLDLSNMSIIEGETGLIVVDPLMYTETAQAAMDLYFQHRPRKPVVAVVYSHSHVDHFGGVRGVVRQEEVDAGRVQVIAPAGFMAEAVGENVIAGHAMGRRALYQFGMLLPRDARGQVDAGLGKAGAPGTMGLIAPTRVIDKPRETLRIDGVDIEFALTPGAEAPAEMIMYYPQLKVLNMAEIAVHTQHNLLPLRGAQVRDALGWSRHLNDALHTYGGKAEILIAQHHWPVWGQPRLQHLLAGQRDTYKYLHDQTVRLMNHGYVGSEIAEMLKMPESLARDGATHAFYGHLRHNIRAIYQHYLGYYEGNPAQLEALPPVPAARKTVEYMGGADAVLRRAQADYERGEYRWVAQIASQLVFADPANQAARRLAANAYEQLGYQMESATARNAFLQGAAELRQGVPQLPRPGSTARDLVRSLPLEMFFDYLGVRLDAGKAAGQRIVLNWTFTDTGEQRSLNLENSALTQSPGLAPAAHASLRLTRATLGAIAGQETTMAEAIKSGQLRIEGDASKVAALMSMLDRFDSVFPMVEPRPERAAQ